MKTVTEAEMECIVPGSERPIPHKCISYMQLVAGTNYVITFRQRFRCGGRKPETVWLKALVFLSLPIAGLDAQPVVRSVDDIG